MAASKKPADSAGKKKPAATPAEKEAARRAKQGFVAPLDADPYEIEWPDDTKEMRAKEQAQLQKNRDRFAPVPFFLSAAVIGIMVILVFVGIVLVAIGEIPFLVNAVAPLVAVGVIFALPIAWAVYRLTSRLQDGLSGAIFMVLGMVIGYAWPNMLLTQRPEWFNLDPAEADLAITTTSLFFMTATGSAFYLARMFGEPLAKRGREIRSFTVLLVVLTIASILSLTNVWTLG